MADLGGLECAAAVWMERLRHTRVPAAHKRAQAHADAERRCSRLLEERLEDERREHAQRKASFTEAQRELQAEQLRRVDAEAALAGALEEKRRAEMAAEKNSFGWAAAERRGAAAAVEIAQLKEIVADDQALRFYSDARAEATTLRKRLGSYEVSLQRVRADFDRARFEWASERETLKRECDGFREALVHQREASQRDMRCLRESGVALQEAADSAAAACAAHVEACAAQVRATQQAAETLGGAFGSALDDALGDAALDGAALGSVAGEAVGAARAAAVAGAAVDCALIDAFGAAGALPEGQLLGLNAWLEHQQLAGVSAALRPPQLTASDPFGALAPNPWTAGT